jgi:G3E family GTPase
VTPPRVPVTLVAGWYGSGKTSLIRHLLSTTGSPADSVDTLVVQGGFPTLASGDPAVVGTEESVVELESSCATCAVRNDLVELLPLFTSRRHPPARVLVELTGGADVVTAAQTLLGDADLRRSTYLDAVICTVDGSDVASRLSSGRDPLPDATVVEQLAVADHAIVSGVADLPPRLADAVCWSLRGIAPTAVLSLDRVPPPDRLLDVGAFDPSAVEQRLLARGGEPAVPPSEHCGIVAATVTVEGPLDPERLECWMDELHHQHGHDLLRLQGLLAVEGEPYRWIVCGARTVIDLSFGGDWGDEPRRSVLEVVGRGLDLGHLRATFAALAHA